MSYQDRWQTAAFRDIEFLTDSHDAKSGRRLAVHEFPGAELPVVEDLGGQAKGWTLNAYFIGADYDTECDALISELNKPGADYLIHPWLGRLWVRARSWTRRETNQEQGFCTLSIEFVAGGASPPAPSQDKVDAANEWTIIYSDTVSADFDLASMSTDTLGTFVANVQSGLDYVRQAVSLASLPLTWSRQIMGVVGSIRTEVGTLAGFPAKYAAAVRGLTNLVGLGGGADLTAAQRPRLVARLAQVSLHAGHGDLSPWAVIDTPLRANLAADAALHGRLWLGAAMQAALTEYVTEADRAASLAAVDAAYDALLPSMPDPVFQAAVSARAALLEAVMAQDLKPRQIRDVVQPLPSTVLAHRMQIDEAVLIARNGVRHPLFVQGRVYG
ncbi:DNA circularization N-terminal domain-containing protein [Methylomonas sp. SURF-2]|uniref:DNA circularization N-terminal domain-containing protein n=1 Tax=Methylomonas subterranea TaxID=2952225 RepID=A0ABT1TCQ7_9GAMM|nr:DNA circularization N-terminal domain-containing protein [Methylomonas sp. SURF-2]MCQ8103242.1 DNA circularization N-terminal domain-containing protein [Methylomonas sp. SURF-2]